MKSPNVFEIQYLKSGFNSQRMYPNESLISFLGTNYFHLSKEDRGEIKILELGCGSGANLWMIAYEGFNTYGIDFSQAGIQYCKEMLERRNVTAFLKKEDMTNLSFDDLTFDVIIDVVSMQHLTYDQHIICYNEIYRCLRPKGKFFSYHLGENSISLKSSKQMIDHCTISNIEKGFPLAENGQTCFISANEVRKELGKIGFEHVVIDKVIKSYSDQTQYIEYLGIVAEK